MQEQGLRRAADPTACLSCREASRLIVAYGKHVLAAGTAVPNAYDNRCVACTTKPGAASAALLSAQVWHGLAHTCARAWHNAGTRGFGFACSSSHAP